MPFTDEQAASIKEQILRQVESFPEDKREGIKEYIKGLNNEQLEQFMIKNKLMKSHQAEGGEESENEGESDNAPKKSGSECVYCMLANKQIDSFAIYEDKDYLGVLEIKPISPGHIVLIPKKHVAETKKLKAKALTIADKIGKHLAKKLDADDFQISSSDELKHAVVNIVPSYKGKELNYKRPQANQKELQELAIKIGKVEKKAKVIKIKTEKGGEKQVQEGKKESKAESKSLIRLPRRIP